MYKYHISPKQDECLICFKPLNKHISLAHLTFHYPLCISCINKFESIDHTILFHHYPLRILYKYNEFFKSLLYQYKGLYDLALKESFLCLYKKELKNKYHSYVIVVAPSSTIDNKARGFRPMEQIALTISDNVFTGLYKTKDYKQSNLSYEERLESKSYISIINKEYLYDKKVLILDDVITSSSTMGACLHLIKACHPLSIEILVLASNHW